MRTLQPRRSSWTGVLVVIAALLVITLFIGGGNAGDESVDITLDELETLVAEDRLIEAEIRVDADSVVGTFEPESSGDDPVPFETPYPDGFEGDLTTLLLGSSATTTVARSGPPLISFILGILPLLLLGGLAVFFVRRMGRSSGGLLNVGRAKAKRFSPDQPHVTFDDVAGLHEAVEELGEIRDFLESPTKYTAMGAKVPKGVLLAGPPGTGKSRMWSRTELRGDHHFPVEGLVYRAAIGDVSEEFPLVGIEGSRQRDLTPDVVNVPRIRLARGTVPGVHLAVREADGHRLQRPAFLVRVHPQRHGRAASQRRQQVVVRGGPGVGATNGGRLVGYQGEPIGKDLGAEAFLRAHHGDALRGIDNEIRLGVGRQIAAGVPIRP